MGMQRVKARTSAPARGHECRAHSLRLHSPIFFVTDFQPVAIGRSVFRNILRRSGRPAGPEVVTHRLFRFTVSDVVLSKIFDHHQPKVAILSDFRGLTFFYDKQDDRIPGAGRSPTLLHLFRFNSFFSSVLKAFLWLIN